MVENANQQKPAPKAKKPAPTAGSEPRMFGATVIVGLIAKFVELIGKVLGAKFFDATAYFFTLIGHWATLVAAGLWFVFCLIAAIAIPSQNLAIFIWPLGIFKLSIAAMIIAGIVGAAVILLLQYIATRFLQSGDRLIKSSPSSMASKGYLECVGLLLLISGLVFFIFGIVGLVSGRVPQFFFSLAWLVITVYWTCFALNQETVNVQIATESSAGQEFIGILSFWAKSALKLVPIAFGVALTVGAVVLVVSAIMCLVGGNTAISGLVNGNMAGNLVFWGLLLPLFAYMGFLAYYLAIDLILAILKLPRLLEKKG
ncbi:MAG: hypothetical protein KJ621_16685 [Proteobacteria bacterium]|nr:hypothetical protein [Pseudomonadota bacterium]